MRSRARAVALGLSGRIGDREFHTRTINDTLDAEWEERFVFEDAQLLTVIASVVAEQDARKEGGGGGEGGEAPLLELYMSYQPCHHSGGVLPPVARGELSREAFVELCESEYVQQVTFDSYLYKKVQGNNPLKDLQLLGETISSLIRGNAMAKPDAPIDNPVESLKRI